MSWKIFEIYRRPLQFYKGLVANDFQLGAVDKHQGKPSADLAPEWQGDHLVLDAPDLQESLGYRIRQMWHRSHVLHFGKNQPRLLAPAGPAISPGRSGGLVNISVREMNSRNAVRYINPTHAGVVQIQTTFQLFVSIAADTQRD
jgi:hypothetical protein